MHLTKELFFSKAKTGYKWSQPWHSKRDKHEGEYKIYVSVNGVWRLKKNLKLFGLLFIEKETFLPLLHSVLTDETYGIKFVRWHLRASLQLVMLKKEFS